MGAEVISFKPKDNLAEEKEVINNFIDGLSPMESYNFFFLDATKDTINTTLEITQWQNAVTDLKYSIKYGLLSTSPENLKGFASMCRSIEDLIYGGIIGVGFESQSADGEVDNWSFMLVKLSDYKYIIRDLIRNGKRIIVRG